MALTPKQLNAIHILLTTKGTQQEVAKEVGVPYRTMKRWLNMPHFQDAMRAEAACLWRHAALRLKAAADRAVSRLVEEMDAKAPNRQRIMAASAVLDHANKLHQMVDLADRVERIEAEIAASGN